MASTESRLWQPLRVGNITLSHRIAMAPLTRYRNDDNHIPQEIMAQYYAERASTPGSLVISEATGISGAAEANFNLPGIFRPQQIEGWARIYRAVHAQGSYIFQQIWDLGRAANPEYVKPRGYNYSSSSDKILKGKKEAPQPLTEEEIWAKIDEYRVAAKNVIAAGGDGVEIHGAHGYLIDQFTRDSVNNRTDKWGGSVENRSRFLLEVVKAVTDEIGAERTGLRLSPFVVFQDSYSSDTWEQTSYIVRRLKEDGYKLAYLSLVEPRGDPARLFTKSTMPEDYKDPFQKGEKSLDFILEEWDNWSPVFVAGGYDAEGAIEVVDGQYSKYDVGVAFGRPYISNPDLVFRARNGIPFSPYNRKTFYIPKSPVGYVDYPFSEEAVASGLQKAVERAVAETGDSNSEKNMGLKL
ncbi:hypothetical protein K4F52_007180 [Lecanicillium sp. MT-2017a]|nr:hypothetical protein K4F52_007180 [Lecanicillium sp. MT-2017a]